MTWRGFPAAVAIAAFLTFAAVPLPAIAQSPVIVAIVNDQPITELDLTEHIEMLTIIENLPRTGMDKKQALQDMIDNIVKTQELKRYNMLPNDADLKDRIKRIAENVKLTVPALMAKLKEKGITEATFRYYLQATMGFNRIIQAKYREDVKASDAEVDAKMAEIKSKVNSEISKIMNDPRMKGVTVYSLMEIHLPVDGEDPGLLQARAADAIAVMQRFKGCGSLKTAAQGIFDVKQGKTFEADASKLPPQMKAALDKAGQGRAIGPMRGKGGIQLIALCGVRKISPPKPDFKMPTREQVQRMVINDKYDKLETDYLNTIRDKVYVEYRDQSYAQQ